MKPISELVEILDLRIFQVDWLKISFFQTEAPAQPDPFTQQPSAIPSEGRGDVGRQQQQDPRSSGDQQHPKPFAPQQATALK